MLAAHPFFSRKGKPADHAPADAAAHAAQRGVLPRIAENAGALFSIAISVLLLGAVVGLLWAFAQELHRDSVVLDAFSAPEDIVKQGYTPVVLSEHILDEIRAIHGKASTARTRRSIEGSSALPDIQLAATGLSMHSIVRYTRALVGIPEPRIGGEIVRDAKGLHVFVRLRDEHRAQTVEIFRGDAEVEGALKDTAGRIVQLIDPYVFAAYLNALESPGKRFPLTLAAIDYVLSHPPRDDDAWAYSLLGWVRYDEGKPDEALEAFRKAASLDAQFQAYVALQLHRLGRSDEALAVLDKAASAARSVQELSRITSTYYGLGRDRDVVALVRRTRYTNPDVLSNAAVALLNLHRPAESIAFLKSARRAHGKSPEFDAMEAQALVDLGRPDEALALADSATTEAPGDPSAHVARGSALARLGRPDEAIEEFRHASTLTTTLRIGPTEWGRVLLARGQHAEARAKFEAALANGPNYGPAIVGKADTLAAMGRSDDALAEYARAASVDPDYPAGWLAWAAQLDRSERGDEAAAKRFEAGKAQARLNLPLDATPNR